MTGPRRDGEPGGGKYGCVVLTQGTRSDELREGLRSVQRQRTVEVDCVVVGNGWRPDGLPAGIRALALPENVGIPAGRNAGIPEVSGDLVLFLDDDARLAEDDFLARAAALFDADPTLGVVQPRVVDPDGRPAPRRWVPRLRVGDPARSSAVTALWEGAVVARRSALERTGAWPDGFFYAHEGIDLAWRMIATGYRVEYRGDLLAHHPAVIPTRHGYFHYLSARNRVWLARRNLPLPLAVGYVSVWFLLTAARWRRVRDAREALRGFRDGLTGPCGLRRPMSWTAVWRMTRAGRPPLI